MKLMKALMIIVAVAAALGVGFYLGHRQAGPAGDTATA